MSKPLQIELDTLMQKLVEMASIAEEMISKACVAVHEFRSDVAAEVIAREHEIDEREVDVEEECLRILARWQPVAIDLRRTTAVLKINSDVERIADLAVNIAERGQCLASEPHFPIPAGIERMMHLAVAMVRSALDAFIKLDVATAKDVRLRDDEVDDLNRESIQELTELMRERPDMISAALHVFSVSRHIERIADHATNIAEDAIYLVEGRIARHRHDDSPITI